MILVPVLVVAVVANRTGGVVRRYRREARDATEAITGFLGIEPGEDIGLGAFISQYSDLAGDWTATVLMSLSRGGGALAASSVRYKTGDRSKKNGG